MRTSTYTYNALNQLASLLGVAQGERYDVQYDANGNLVYYALDHKGEAGMTYSWTIDDRLASARVSEDGSPDATVSYAYDASGARILRRAPDGTRQRYFFHGLTEEVTKQSVPGVASDTASACTRVLDGSFIPAQWIAPSGNVAGAWNTARRSEAVSVAGNTYAIHGRDYRGGGAMSYDYSVTGKRVMSAWVRSAGDAEFIVTVQSNQQLRGLRYCMFTSSNDAVPFVYWPNLALFGSTLRPDGAWHRIERDLAADLAAAWPGETLVAVRGTTYAAYTAAPVLVDDIAFSNAITVEHNVLGPGEVAHILRTRTTTGPAGGYAATDAWYAFNQVGSVLNHSNSSGAMTQAIDMDAWGIPTNGTNGSWNSTELYRTLNSKRFESNASTVFFWQRWADPSIGMFLSQDPVVKTRNRTTLLEGSPVINLDPKGLDVLALFDPAAEVAGIQCGHPAVIVCMEGVGCFYFSWAANDRTTPDDNLTIRYYCSLDDAKADPDLERYKEYRKWTRGRRQDMAAILAGLSFNGKEYEIAGRNCSDLLYVMLRAGGVSPAQVKDNWRPSDDWNALTNPDTGGWSRPWPGQPSGYPKQCCKP
ncbi:hypothetical protein CVU37_06415 [candidate division BRC1 bacterium HGW-BRC1-1]|jgi:YD repeat-containing protein|nr:MAG: hypothetical protein CVU37_06415 [candidate division BRC1 bacterium HGW-BRC1-1]